MKVLAVIDTGLKYNFVLDEMPEMIHWFETKELILGEDKTKTFVSSYEYYVDPFTGSFGGSNFYITMDDGSEKDIGGVWWDRGSKGFNCKTQPIGIGTPESLADCFVFYALTIKCRRYNQLLKEYQGKIYDAYNFQKIFQAGEWSC